MKLQSRKGNNLPRWKPFIILSPITMEKFTKTERHELLYKTKNTKVYSYESLSWDVIAEVTVDNDWYEIDNIQIFVSFL